jgi:hypothetical protein
MFEVAQNDPAMIAPSKKSAPAPEATKLCEVWEAGECVFMADNRRQAEAWAKAHQIRGAEFHELDLTFDSKPKPSGSGSARDHKHNTLDGVFSSSHSKSIDDVPMGSSSRSGPAHEDEPTSGSSMSRSLKEVTFNPKITYSGSPIKFDEPTSGPSQSSYAPPPKFGRRAQHA